MTGRHLFTFWQIIDGLAPSLHSKCAERSSLIDIPQTPFADTMQQLIESLPSSATVATSLERFLIEVNWRFGIPEPWLRSMISQTFNSAERCAGATTNPRCLALIFTILAFVLPPFPLPDQDSTRSGSSERYFVCAMSALHITEVTGLFRPSSYYNYATLEAVVPGCLAVPLLCSFLADRGRVSEGWKLVGHWIRIAQAAGMHRDPRHGSDKDKSRLRRAWWGLIICDQ